MFPANTFGQLFSMTTFGESHGKALGVVIDGCPSNITWEQQLLEKELSRRRPGHHLGTSMRKEQDLPEVLSGVFDGKTLGTPIAIIVRNHDQRSNDYKNLHEASKNSSDSTVLQRQGHADHTWKEKFGHVDWRGGGRSSGRETVSRVMAGAVAKMFLNHLYPNLKIISFLSQVGPYELDTKDYKELLKNLITTNTDYNFADKFPARFPSFANKEKITDLLQNCVNTGDSVGGTVDLLICNPPASLGEPVFHKLKSEFAAALLSIGACSSFELGTWNQHKHIMGTDFHQNLDRMNAYGGIQGGISTGEPILCRIGFKPTSSILDIAKQGRHDPCIAIRASVVAEAMIAIVLANFLKS